MAKFVCKDFPSIDTDWSKWKFFFCDERNVPVDDENSTLKLYLKDLLERTTIKKEQLVAVNTSLDGQWQIAKENKKDEENVWMFSVTRVLLLKELCNVTFNKCFF